VSYNVLRYVSLAFAHRLWKWLANSPPIYRTVLGTVLKQFSGKQSSPFMELFGQLCLTTWATVSYCLCKCVLLLVQVCLTAWASVSYYLCKCVLLLVQVCLTAWAIVSYCLWKCLTNSPAIYRTVLGTVLEQFSGKQPSPLMEMLSRQSSPFMELFGQLCLTTWATVSYCLCNYVLLFVQLCLTAWATLSYYLCNCVLLLVEMVSEEFSHLWKRF